MNLNIFKKNSLLWLYLGGALLVLLAAWLWCAKISVDPERVFWGTVERGLATRGVTIHAEQTNGGTTVDQTIQYSMGASNLSHTVTTLSQQGTTVKNEMIGTPTADYTRYVSVKTNEKGADGRPLDVSKLIGVWAKGPEGSGQFFSQAVFGLSLPIGGLGLPTGNLSAKARNDLMRQIRNDNVYQISFEKTKKERKDGRLLYTYDATLQPVAYVALMRAFARSVGLHSLDQWDPASYKNHKPFSLQITVDARSRQVVSIAAPDTGSKQTYLAHDVPVRLELPKKTITGAQLQQLLSNL